MDKTYLENALERILEDDENICSCRRYTFTCQQCQNEFIKKIVISNYDQREAIINSHFEYQEKQLENDLQENDLHREELLELCRRTRLYNRDCYDDQSESESENESMQNEEITDSEQSSLL